MFVSLGINVYAKVVAGKRVSAAKAMRAVRNLSALDIHHARHWLQVMRCTAGTLTTQVIQLKAGRNWPDETLIDNPM
jgi:hypothetical protein